MLPFLRPRDAVAFLSQRVQESAPGIRAERLSSSEKAHLVQDVQRVLKAFCMPAQALSERAPLVKELLQTLTQDEGSWQFLRGTKDVFEACLDLLSSLEGPAGDPRQALFEEFVRELVPEFPAGKLPKDAVLIEFYLRTPGPRARRAHARVELHLRILLGISELDRRAIAWEVESRQKTFLGTRPRYERRSFFEHLYAQAWSAQGLSEGDRILLSQVGRALEIDAQTFAEIRARVRGSNGAEV